jgi:hypothetical protein
VRGALSPFPTRLHGKARTFKVVSVNGTSAVSTSQVRTPGLLVLLMTSRINKMMTSAQSLTKSI